MSSLPFHVTFLSSFDLTLIILFIQLMFYMHNVNDVLCQYCTTLEYHSIDVLEITNSSNLVFHHVKAQPK